MQLYGWDTVFATSTAHANEALAQSKEAIALPFKHTDGDITVSGSAAGWSIVPGGSGQLIHLKVDIANGEYKDGDETTEISGIGVVLEISLKLAPASSPDTGAFKTDEPPQKLFLQFDLRTVNKLTPDSALGWSAPRGAGAVTPVRIDDPSGKLGELDKMIISDAIAAFLVERSQYISTVLAEIDLVKHGETGWLAPTDTAYAYVERQDGVGALSIFSVTDGRSIENIERSIDPTLITADAEGYFAISPQMFLRNVILPMMPGAFGNGAKAKNFTFDVKANAIRNVGHLKANKTKGYQPMIHSVTTTIKGGSLHTAVSGKCDMNFMGVEMSFSVSAVSPLTYDPKSQKIGFKEDPEPTSTHSYSIPFWTRALWYALAILPGVIMDVVVSMISKSIANGLTGQTGNLMLAKNPPRTVHWAGAKEMQVKQAGLADAFFMRGVFN